MRKVGAAEEFASGEGVGRPCAVGGINGQPVESARPKGAYGWRAHAAEDWMSRLSGDAFAIRLRGDIDLAPGGLFIIPRGAEHMPVRAEERRVRLFEPAATKH